MPKYRRTTPTSNTYRFFVDPSTIVGERATLDGPELVHQIAAVLRLAPGDRVTLLDGSGKQYTVALERVERRGPITGIVERVEDAPGEPGVQLTLFLPLIRSERFEWALQKGTELGVSAFVPTHCAHSIVEGGTATKKLERWRAIVREAAEQSRRARLPALEQPVAFAEACKRAAESNAMLLWEGVGATGLRSVLRQLSAQGPQASVPHPSSLIPHPWSVLSGPEGGISEDERRIAAGHGIIEVSLGPRTLRAETAPLVAATAIFYELGELG